MSNTSSKNRDDSFAVGDSPRVVVSTNRRVIVNSGPDRTVSVKATLRKPDDLEYEINQEGDTISVEVRERSRGIFNFGETPGADIEITAPSNTRVDFRTNNGSVEVYGMQQSGTVRTSNGKIVLDKVSGDFKIATRNGRVTIAKAIGSFDVETRNGRIKFDGELASGGNNRMTTRNGSIEIKLQGTPSVKLEASTNNGSINTEYPTLTSSPRDRHRLAGNIGAGEAVLLVRTRNGSMVIR